MISRRPGRASSPPKKDSKDMYYTVTERSGTPGGASLFTSDAGKAGGAGIDGGANGSGGAISASF